MTRTHTVHHVKNSMPWRRVTELRGLRSAVLIFCSMLSKSCLVCTGGGGLKEWGGGDTENLLPLFLLCFRAFALPVPTRPENRE